MRSRLFLLCFASLLITSARAQTTATGSNSNPSSTRATTRTSTAKGPLPDPALLDGSAQPAEKHPDYGMLGDFEIPGDENSKSGKVGGQQNPNQKGGGGGQQQPQNQSQMPGISVPLPGPANVAGGGDMQPSLPSVPQAGGGAAGGQQGGGQPGGPQGAQQAGAQGAAGASGAQGDPNAKADGIQVAGLDGDPSAAGAAGAGGSGDNVPKPQQVAIGDRAMQINPAPNAPGAVGQVAVSNSTQQMESKIGKGSGAGPSGGNGGGHAVEKGRTMPSGL